MFSRRTVLASLVISPVSIALGQDKRAGTIKSLIGTASAQRASQKLVLAERDPVFEGDFLATDQAARLSVLLGANTVLQLGELTKVSIDRFLIDMGGVINLTAGGILLDKPKTTRAIDIRSPFGLIAVRGTQVFIGPSRGSFGVFVIRGNVTVSNANKTVDVAESFGTDIASPISQPIDPVRWGDGRVKAALASVN